MTLTDVCDALADVNWNINNMNNNIIALATCFAYVTVIIIAYCIVSLIARGMKP